MRVGVVGSRNYPRLDLVAACVGRLARWGEAHGKAIVIVSGTEPRFGRAPGVDETAVSTARKLGLEAVVHEADWKRFFRRAGPLRNTTIIDDSEYVVAYWCPNAKGEWSRGTADSIGKALRAGKLAKVTGPDGEPLEFDVVGEILRQTLGG